jgi:hypothetical protein
MHGLYANRSIGTVRQRTYPALLRATAHCLAGDEADCRIVGVAVLRACDMPLIPISDAALERFS